MLRWVERRQAGRPDTSVPTPVDLRAKFASFYDTLIISLIWGFANSTEVSIHSEIYSFLPSFRPSRFLPSVCLSFYLCRFQEVCLAAVLMLLCGGDSLCAFLLFLVCLSLFFSFAFGTSFWSQNSSCRVLETRFVPVWFVCKEKEQTLVGERGTAEGRDKKADHVTLFAYSCFIIAKRGLLVCKADNKAPGVPATQGCPT